jgi:molecular chaperone GrpE
MKVEAPQEMEQLRSQLEALQKERDDLFARLQRLSADYANYQKRVQKQITDSVEYEKEKLIRSVLPVCDNFELTIQKAGTGENTEMVLAGVQIVYEQMLDVLKAHEVEPIKATDTKFDPSRHEALMQRCDPEKEDGLILEECQRGYMLAGRVLRPSKVIVNKAPISKAQDADVRQPEGATQGENASEGE